jgi:hypothetical protein
LFDMTPSSPAAAAAATSTVLLPLPSLVSSLCMCETVWLGCGTVLFCGGYAACLT